MDVDAVEVGEDFLARITREVASCQLFITLIGNDWSRLMRERLSNPDDYVRSEVAAALDRGIRVIPVLVEGASMPTKAELPPRLARLSERNAFYLSDLHWRSEVNLLVAAIQRVLEETEREKQALGPHRRAEARIDRNLQGDRRGALPSQPRGVSLARNRRNVILVGSFGAIAVVTGVLIGAGVLSGGGGDKKSSDEVTASTPLFTATVPAGWKQSAEVRKAKGHLRETTWREPSDTDTSVLVDVLPNASSNPGDRARRVRAQTSTKPGYEELGFRPTRLSGRDGVEWLYRVEGKQYVDYFLNSCKDAFAVLGSTAPHKFKDLEQAFRRVAESLRSRSC